MNRSRNPRSLPRRVALGVIAGSLMAGPVAAQTGPVDPLNGSWKLNVAKSTFTPGTEARNEIVTYKVNGDEQSFNADGYTATGARDQFFYTARYDGKEHPSKTVLTEERMASMKKVDARTHERFSKVNGKLVMRSRRVVSADGKAMTTTVYAVAPDGKETVRETRVYDHQGAPAGDPFNGTWILDATKSKYNDPSTASRKETIRITVAVGGETDHVEEVMPNGSIEVQDYAVKYDGKDYANKAVNTVNGMVTLRRVDARTHERLTKSNGKIVGISRRVVSPDGKMLTTTLLSVDDKGKESVRQVRVFDKQ